MLAAVTVGAVTDEHQHEAWVGMFATRASLIREWSAVGFVAIMALLVSMPREKARG